MKMKMKKIVFLYLSFVLLFTSCDPRYFFEYKINNSSGSDIEISFMSSSIGPLDTLHVAKNTIQTWMASSDYSPASKLDLTPAYDSIVVSVNKSPVIIYKPETEGKNIYYDEYWAENKKSKREYEYTFEITDKDIRVP